MVVSRFGQSLRKDYDPINPPLDQMVPQPQNVPAVMGKTSVPTSAPSGLGDLMAPASNPNGGAPAPMAGGEGGGAPDFEAKVKRNESFLGNPDIQNALLDFAIGIMAPGMTTEERQNQQKIDLANQQFGIETGQKQQQLEINKQELELKKKELIAKGGRKYSKLVTGESPMGMELGIQKGTRARVEIMEDAQGNFISASVQDNPDPDKGANTPTQISKFNAEADAAEKAGNPRLAQQLRQAATREATGISYQGALEPGTRLVPGADGTPVVETIPGSKLDTEQKAAEEGKKVKRTKEIQTNLNVSRAVNMSLAKINDAVMPDMTLTGFGSYLEFVRGTGANDLANSLNTVKANLGFMKLQDLRDASKTGGAVGNVSDFENRLMQSTTASVENSQTAKQLVQNLRYIKAIFTDVQGDGKLSQIGNKLDPTHPDFDPNYNEAMALQEASDYLGGLAQGGAAAVLDANTDHTDTAPPIMAPEDASPALKSSWHGLSPDEQKEAIQLLEKKRNK